MFAGFKRHPFLVIGGLAVAAALAGYTVMNVWGSSPAAAMMRMCSRQTFTPPIDCHPNIPASQSHATLAAYQQEVETWATGPLPHSQNLYDARRFPPSYWTLPLRFDDRIAAEKARQAAQETFGGRVLADVNEGVRTGRYHQAAAAAQTPATPPAVYHVFTLAFLVIILVFAAGFGVQWVLWMRKQQLLSQGYEDLYAAWNRMRFRFTLGGLVVGAIPAAYLFYTAHPLLAGFVMILAWGTARTLQNRLWLQTDRGSYVVYKPQNTGAQGGVSMVPEVVKVDQPRFFKRPPPPKPDKAHGGARFHSPSSMRRRGGPPPATPRAPGEPDFAAFFATLSNAELEAFGKASTAQKMAIMRKAGF